MSDKIYIRPGKGLIVWNPATQRELPTGGAWVPNDRHWRRMLRAGDVQAGKPTRSKKASKQKPISKDDEAQQ